MQFHELKCDKDAFEEIKNGNKNFEYRKNDRNFKKGDFLVLHEYDPVKKEYIKTNGKVANILVFVTYILYGPDYGIPKEYCVMSIAQR